MKATRFNIAHIVPVAGHRSVMHGLLGYREVIETLRWGLAELGHEVSVAENSFRGDCVNILFGAQMLSNADLQQLPADTIVYNFEQIGGMQVEQLKPEIRTVADRFLIWDYSEANVATWDTIGSAKGAVHLPVAWAPTLRRIPRSDPQDIDALFYGRAGPLRMQVFSELCDGGLKCMFVSGLYDDARDALIGRSKIVLNINKHQSRIFEIVRVSYLLANAKAVVADRQDETFIEPEVESAVVFCAPDRILSECERLLDDEPARRAVEEHGRAVIEERVITKYLAPALARIGEA